jgi:hypothetical protein
MPEIRCVKELGGITTTTNMKRIIWQFIIIAFVALRVPAQTPLEFFTNQANALLQAEFGFGVTNIPVYSTTNPAVGYSASVHYLLQSAANDYDATTPATNFPSVFRPVFSWQTNTLFIVGYTCVTTDFYAQIGCGFKAISDPTITANDNVWGIPWVVGAKGQTPAFNEYCYSSEVIVERDLLFVRYPAAPAGQYDIYRPPQYTNQFYIMSVSNIFGAEAWNFYPTTFTNSVTLVVSNQVSVTMTNNYNFGTNMVFDAATNWTIDSWPAGGFMIPLFTNTTSLPFSYWSESTEQFVTLSAPNGFLASDFQQTGWPVHVWTLNITNNLMYALVDNGTGRVLDFVNLGAFGSSLNINQTLANIFSELPFNVWTVAPATDAPNSPMSEGALNQIVIGMEESLEFLDSLLGLSGGYPGSVGIFSAPFGVPSGAPVLGPAYASFIQSCSWQAGNPMVHYTIGDLANPGFNEDITIVPPVLINSSLASSMSNSVCSLGEVNPDYNSGAVEDFCFDLSNGLFQIGFSGAADLPYAVWASTNILDWCQIGTVAQPSPGVFQFEDPAATNYSARFYQVRLP